jgi:TonB family protein
MSKTRFASVAIYGRICPMKTLLLLTITLILFSNASPQDARPKVLSVPEYIIPAEASKAGIDGKVLVLVSVRKDGTVDRVDFWAGPSWPCGSEPKDLITEVRNGVIDAFKKARFSPALKNGDPVDGTTGLSMLIGERYANLKKISVRNALGTGKDLVNDASTVRGAVINGKAISLPKPEYPRGFYDDRPRGVVQVEVVIDEKGEVISAGAISGDPRLQKPARKAACLARFSPTLLAGQPVKVSGIVTYNFVP